MSDRKPRRTSTIPLLRMCAAWAITGSLAACEMPRKTLESMKDAGEIAPVAVSKSTLGGGQEESGVTAAQLEKWLRAHVESDKRSVATRAQIEVVAEGKHWRVGFPDRLLAPGQPVKVEIVRHPAMTVMMAPLLRVPKNPPAEMLGALLAQNYELYQAKLSLGPQGDLYVSYEVPNRLLDRQELIDDVEDLSLLAQNLTGLVEQRLVELALGMGTEGAPRQPQAAPQQQMPPPGARPAGPDFAQFPTDALPPTGTPMPPPMPSNAVPPAAPSPQGPPPNGMQPNGIQPNTRPPPAQMAGQPTQ